MSEDWLGTEDPKPVATDRMVKARAYRQGAYVPAKAIDTPQGKRKELLALRRELPKMHTDYLECMQEAGFHFENARVLMLERGYAYDRSTYTRWRSKARLQRALALAEELALEAASLTAGRVLGRVNAISDYGMEKIVLRDKDGNQVKGPKGEDIYVLRDPKLALKANELLGKNKRLWNDDESARVTVQLVNLTGDEALAPDPIDGDFIEQ